MNQSPLLDLLAILAMIPAVVLAFLRAPASIETLVHTLGWMTKMLVDEFKTAISIISS
jgi:hypothetical protein